MVGRRPRPYPHPAALILLPVLAFGSFVVVLKQRETKTAGSTPRPTSNTLNPPAYIEDNAPGPRYR
jgi:hypothetical protein